MKLIDDLKRFSLRNLELSVLINGEAELAPITDLIIHQKGLLQLKLHITLESAIENESHTKALINSIAQLQQIHSLKLHFKVKANLTKKTIIFDDLHTLLKPLFSKPTKLRVFGFSCNQAKPSETFLGLVDLVKPVASTIEKLNISVGEFNPQKAQFPVVLSFIRSLVNIRSLKLESLSIPLRQFLMEIVDAIYTLKYLRVLHLGEIKGTVTKDSYVYANEQFMIKPGMRKFHSEISKDFLKSLAKKVKSNPRFDMYNIFKKNPMLSTLPPSSLIGSDYQAFGRDEW